MTELMVKNNECVTCTKQYLWNMNRVKACQSCNVQITQRYGSSIYGGWNFNSGKYLFI